MRKPVRGREPEGEDWTTNPEVRGTLTHLTDYQGNPNGTEPNRFGVVGLKYECTPYGTVTGWGRFRCGKCNKEFWKRSPLSQASGCGGCGNRGGGPRLDLLGKTFGAIRVVGHERGKGWKVECRCGRTKVIAQGTAIANGGHKTCGQCTEEERHRGTATASATTATESAGASFVASDNNGRVGLGFPFPYECSKDHDTIWHSEVDCPLCIALARIELQS